MNYRNLGITGLQVSEIALGTMQFGWTADEETAFAVMDAYVAEGGNLIDTADVYSRWAEGNAGGVSETMIGRWLAARKNRHQIVLATKVRGRMWEGPNGEGLSRGHIMKAVDDSLRRLQTDYIDLYQTHSFDPKTPIEETMRALDDLVRAGKVRYLGCSNYPAWRLVEALWSSERGGLDSFSSVQPHYNLVHREEFERDLGDVAEGYGLGVIPYSPLAGGFLTGKYRRGQEMPPSERAARIQKRYMTDRNFDVLDKMEEIGRAHGQGIPQVALAWLLANPLVSAPIVGANSVEQLQASLQAIDLELSYDELDTLDRMSAWQEEEE